MANSIKDVAKAKGPLASSEAGRLFVLLAVQPLNDEEAAVALSTDKAKVSVKAVQGHFNFWSYRKMLERGPDGRIQLTEKGRKSPCLAAQTTETPAS